MKERYSTWRKKSPYYDGFVTQNSYCCKAAATLQEVLNHFDPEVLPQKREEMHAIEHDADSTKHKMMEQLAREFITPIEREDIIELAQAIDDVTDNIEDVLMRMYMYHMQEVRPEARQFAEPDREVLRQSAGSTFRISQLPKGYKNPRACCRSQYLGRRR